MTNSISGIPTTRVSDLFVRDRLLNQVQYDQAELLRIQTQLSTGHRFDIPSDDPVAAARVAGLQALLQRKGQLTANVSTNQ
jgi:flagellar hook-associated protein 3 FlgL